MKKGFVVPGITAICLISCSLSQINPFKRVIDHPQPEIVVDNSFFQNLGCFESTDCLPEAIKNNPYAIESIYPVTDLYGGLNPAYPVAIANSVRFAGEEEVPAVFKDKCMGTFYNRYLVMIDEMRLIESVEQLKELYAPIENEDEALSFAIAVTGYSALYDLNGKLTYKFYQNPLEESYSRLDGNQFTVHLFNDFLCGCSPHIVQSIDVTVSQEGEFSLAEPVDAFSDRLNDGMCID
jgi:hypothetical protein